MNKLIKYAIAGFSIILCIILLGLWRMGPDILSSFSGLQIPVWVSRLQIPALLIIFYFLFPLLVIFGEFIFIALLFYDKQKIKRLIKYVLIGLVLGAVWGSLGYIVPGIPIVGSPMLISIDFSKNVLHSELFYIFLPIPIGMLLGFLLSILVYLVRRNKK